jgi:hypothetical protein
MLSAATTLRQTIRRSAIRYYNRKVDHLNAWAARESIVRAGRRRRREQAMRVPGNPTADLVLTTYLCVLGATFLFSIALNLMGPGSSPTIPWWLG